jgi:GDPmannose 4,6-dehydratase
VNAVIFGANGQDGHYLSQLCRAKGIVPIGVSRSGSWVRGDVSSFDDVSRLIKQHLPAYVFHLAAVSTTRHDALFENHATIATGTLNILESVRKWCPTAKVFIVGSGVQFENEGLPISEKARFSARNPYSVARIQSVFAARYYRSLGIRAYVGFLFHHESPLRKECHISQLVASAATRIGLGSGETLELGDLSVEKEWTFAGDVARAMFDLLEQEDVFEATLGSGVGHSIEEWLEECFGIVGRDWRPHVKTVDRFVAEYKRMVSDPTTIMSLGWRPRVGFQELARMMIGQHQRQNQDDCSKVVLAANGS